MMQSKKSRRSTDPRPRIALTLSSPVRQNRPNNPNFNSRQPILPISAVHQFFWPIVGTSVANHVVSPFQNKADDPCYRIFQKSCRKYTKIILNVADLFGVSQKSWIIEIHRFLFSDNPKFGWNPFFCEAESSKVQLLFFLRRSASKVHQFFILDGESEVRAILAQSHLCQASEN